MPHSTLLSEVPLNYQQGQAHSAATTSSTKMAIGLRVGVSHPCPLWQLGPLTPCHSVSPPRQAMENRAPHIWKGCSLPKLGLRATGIKGNTIPCSPVVRSSRPAPCLPCRPLPYIRAGQLDHRDDVPSQAGSQGSGGGQVPCCEAPQPPASSQSVPSQSHEKYSHTAPDPQKR